MTPDPNPPAWEWYQEQAGGGFSLRQAQGPEPVEGRTAACCRGAAMGEATWLAW